MLKRYDLDPGMPRGSAEMVESPYGDYVLFNDVAAERDGLRQKVERQRNNLDAIGWDRGRLAALLAVAEQRAEEMKRCWNETRHKLETELSDRMGAEAEHDRLVGALDSVFAWLRTWAVERPDLPVTLEVVDEWKARVAALSTPPSPAKTAPTEGDLAGDEPPPEPEREDDAGLALRWLRHAAEEEEDDEARDALLWAADTLEVKEYLRPWARKKMGLASTPTGGREATHEIVPCVACWGLETAEPTDHSACRVCGGKYDAHEERATPTGGGEPMSEQATGGQVFDDLPDWRLVVQDDKAHAHGAWCRTARNHHGPLAFTADGDWVRIVCHPPSAYIPDHEIDTRALLRAIGLAAPQLLKDEANRVFCRELVEPP